MIKRILELKLKLRLNNKLNEYQEDKVMLDNTQNIISVEDFLNKFDATSSEQEQHDVIREIIVDEYVPYLVKKVTLVPAINESIIKNDGALPYFDDTLFEVNYFVCRLLLYTNLNIEEYLNNYSPFDLYDEFCKRGIKQSVLGFVNVNEQTEIDTLVVRLKKNWEKMNSGVANLLYSFYQQMMNIDFSKLENVMEQVNYNSNN